jgi:hypothetical protein
MQWRGSKSNLQDFIQDSLIEKIGLTLRSHTMLFKAINTTTTAKGRLYFKNTSE